MVVTMEKARSTTQTKTSWTREGLLLQDFQDILGQTGQNLFSPSAYDTAWVARVNQDDNPRVSAFPQALNWLAHNQNEDGSWGEGGMAEKVLSTLAAVTALAEKSHRTSDCQQVETGLGYIWRCLHKFQPSSTTLPVGFELLLGTLVDEARSLNLNIPEWLGANYQAYREQKWNLLRQIPTDKLSTSSVIFSMEFMLTDKAGYADNIDTELFILSNGSVGVSPAATAAMIKYVKDPTIKAKMLDYLAQTAIPHKTENSLGWGNLGNAEIFEILWVLYNLKISGYQHHVSLGPVVHRLLKQLTRSWSDAGLSMSQFFPVNDGDITSVAYVLLDEYGMTANPSNLNSNSHNGSHKNGKVASNVKSEVFDLYWKNTHLATYQFERDASVSTNVHGLEVFERTGHPQRVKQILEFLRDTRQGNPFWLDKWHASPYYTTTHAIMATCGIDSTLSAPAMNWIINTQHQDGGWGYKTPTAEETAYALHALIFYARKQGWKSEYKQAVRNGTKFLHQTYRPFSLETPALWIGKNFYNPYLIVHSAVLAALLLVESLEWDSMEVAFPIADQQRIYE
jgi:halimadienyl-diphosphate synthase